MNTPERTRGAITFELCAENDVLTSIACNIFVYSPVLIIELKGM